MHMQGLKEYVLSIYIICSGPALDPMGHHVLTCSNGNDNQACNCTLALSLGGLLES